MPTVLLVRHAQGSFRTADYDVLSERGEQQARALGADLRRRGIRVDRVVAGSLARQSRTADPIAGAAGVEVEADARWDEYETDDLIARHVAPEVMPTTTREFQSLLDDALRAWVADRSAGASWPAFRDRVCEALTELAGTLESGECALVCSSGGPIAAVCVKLLGLPDDALVAFNRVMVNGSVTKVVSGSAGMTLVSFNEHAYLEGPGGSLVSYR